MSMRMRFVSSGIPLVFLLACGSAAGGEADAVAAPDPLPDAPGKEETLKGCLAGCHEMGIFNQDYTPQEWQTCVNDMIGLGAPITEKEYFPILNYLAKHLVKKEGESGTPAPDDDSAPDDEDG